MSTEITTGHAWIEGRCATCGATALRPWAETCRTNAPGVAAELSLALRQAARDHLGLTEGDYWPSYLAAAQASYLIDAGWCVMPPNDRTQPDTAAESDVATS